MEVPAVDEGDGDGEEQPPLSPHLPVSGGRRQTAVRQQRSNSSSRRRRINRRRRQRRRVEELLMNPPDGHSHCHSDSHSHSHRVRGQLRWLFQLDQDFPDTFRNTAKSLPARRIGTVVEPSPVRRPGNVPACVKDEEEEQEGRGGRGGQGGGGFGGCLDPLELCSAFFGSSSDLWSFDEEEDKSKESSPATSSSFSLMADEDTEKWGRDDWQFQAELLMAECNLLRVEKELAERGWQQSCVTMDQAVRLAQTLRAKLFCAQMQGRRREAMTENIDSLLNESDNLLLQQLSQDKLERSLRRTGNEGDNYSYDTVPIDSDEAFDEQRRTPLSLRQCIFPSSEAIKPWGGDSGAIQTLQEKLQNLLLFPRSSTTGDQSKGAGCDPDATNNNNNNNRVLQKSPAANGDCTTEVATMQEHLDVSRDLEETQDIAAFIRKEYRSMFSNNGGARHSSSRLNRMQGGAGLCEEAECREAVKKMIEAEAEQWSQVQCILRHVNKEMEDLRKERDIWEQKALHTQAQLTALQEGVYEWRVRTGAAEEEAMLLRSEVEALKGEVEKVKERHAREQARWLMDAGALNNNNCTTGGSGSGMKSKTKGKSFCSPLLSSGSSSGEECRRSRRSRRSRSRSIQAMNLLQEEEEEEEVEYSSSSSSSKENMFTEKMHKLGMGMHSSRGKSNKTNKTNKNNSKKRNSLFPHSIALASPSASPSSSLRSPLGEAPLNHQYHHHGMAW